MFIRNKDVYLYLTKRVDEAESEEEREYFESLLQLFLSNESYNEMYIEEDDMIDDFYPLTNKFDDD